MVKVTKEIIERGKSINGGWNMEQLKLIGIDKLSKGWMRTMVGREVPEENVEKFIELKDAHFLGKSNQNPKERVRKKIVALSFEPVKKDIAYQDQYKHPNWQKMRLMVLERDNYRCVNCGEKHKTLHAHHLKYLKGKFIWDVPRWYIVTLCEECHSEEHGRDLTISKTMNKGNRPFSCDACGNNTFHIVGANKECKLCGWQKSDGGK